MKSIKLVKFIVEFVCIMALAKGNLITYLGQCPFGDLKPPGVTIYEILDKITIPGVQIPFNSVAETVPWGSGNNRTNIRSILKRVPVPNSPSDAVIMMKIFKSKESGLCGQYEIIFYPTSQPGVYDLLYQVAPGTDYVNYKGYILSYTEDIFLSVLFICHNLPNSQFQFEISVLSANSLLYDSRIQEEANKVLEANNLQYLAPYLTAIDQQNDLDKNCLIV